MESRIEIHVVSDRLSSRVHSLVHPSIGYVPLADARGTYHTAKNQHKSRLYCLHGGEYG